MGVQYGPKGAVIILGLRIFLTLGRQRKEEASYEKEGLTHGLKGQILLKISTEWINCITGLQGIWRNPFGA